MDEQINEPNENIIKDITEPQFELLSTITPKVTIEDTDVIDIYGTDEQRKEMFKDWAGYIGEIQNPENSAVNPFFKKPDGSGSLYSPLDEVLSNSRPILSKYGFGLFQIPTAETGRVSVKTILTHKNGGMIVFPALRIPTTKNDAQGVISSITYARRGALNPILATHGETDDDGNSASTPQKKPQSAQTDELKEVKANIVKLANELGGSSNEALMTLIKGVVASGNTNTIKELDVANKLYNDMKIFRDKNKKENK